MLLGILFIIENCCLDWWKAAGMRKYIILLQVELTLLLSLNRVSSLFILSSTMSSTVITVKEIFSYLYSYCNSCNNCLTVKELNTVILNELLNSVT